MSFFAENLSLKLTALLLAVLLKLYFYSADNSIKADLRVPLEVKNIPSGKMIVEPAHGGRGLYVTLTVAGPASLVEQVRRAQYKFDVVLPAGKDKYKFVPDPYQLNLPYAVKVLDVEPASIDWSLERVVKKELSVVVSKSGDPAKGFRIASIKVKPERILAQGALSKLDGVSLIESKLVDVSGLAAFKRLEVELVEIAPSVKLSVNVVTVEIDIKPVVVEKLFKGVAVRAIAPKGFAVSAAPSKVNVVLAGPVTALKRLDPDKLVMIADAGNLSAGRHKVELDAELPQDVIIMQTLPKRVSVSVSE